MVSAKRVSYPGIALLLNSGLFLILVKTVTDGRHLVARIPRWGSARISLWG